MSHSHGNRPEFPELSIPQSEKVNHRSPLRIIEPYVEYAADLEADIAKISVGSEDRARTATAHKKSRGSNNNKTPHIRSSTAGQPPTHPSSSPGKGRRQQQTVGQQQHARSKGPELQSARSVRSPRAIRTAPEPSRQHTQEGHDPEGQGLGQESTSQSQGDSQAASHFSHDSGGSSVTVRESLQHLKRNTVSCLICLMHACFMYLTTFPFLLVHTQHKPPGTAPPPALYDSMVVPKSSFAKAVDSIAALKLHDYALKRKERMKNRFKLWDEIKGTTRELEISGAEVAFMEFQEVIAAWKIKYYVSKSKAGEKFTSCDEERRALIRQCKGLKKKNSLLQRSIDDHLSLNLAGQAQSLLEERECLRREAEQREEVIEGLRGELQKSAEEMSSLEEVLEGVRSANKEREEEDERRVQASRDETLLVREDLEVSRRTAGEYLRSVMQLEVTLQERVDEVSGLRNGDLQESHQKSLRIQALEQEQGLLEARSRGDVAQIQALEQGVEGLRAQLSGSKKALGDSEATCEDMRKENVRLSTQEEEQRVKIVSLEKLVTEVTYQKEQLTRQLADKETVSGTYLVQTVELKDVIAAKEGDLEEHRFALSQMEEYTKYAQDVNEIANAEREAALMEGEDLLVRLQGGREALQQSINYCRMLESQLVIARRREIYSGGMSRESAAAGGSVSVSASFPAPGRGKGEDTGSIFSDKIDFGALAAESSGDPDFSHPLEGRLVSLLGALEGKLSQLDDRGSRRKSVQPVQDKEKDKEKDEEGDKQPEGDDGDITGREQDLNQKEEVSVREQSGPESDKESAEKEGEKSKPTEVDWEELCLVLEEQLAAQKSKLEGHKQDLSSARESIQSLQREKERLRGDIKRWQREEQKRTGKLPTVKGNSVESRRLFSRSEEVENEMQQFLVDAQTIATTALNCKMECDRVQDELYEADSEAYEVRLAAQLLQQEEERREQEELDAMMQEDELLGALQEQEHRQQQHHEQLLQQQQKWKQDNLPPKARSENRATISMLNQNHFSLNAPEKAGGDADLAVLHEEEEGDEFSFLGSDHGSHHTQHQQEQDQEENAVRQQQQQHQYSLSLSVATMNSSDLARLDEEYAEQLSALECAEGQRVDPINCEALFRLIHTKLQQERVVLLELEDEKAAARLHIEKWTLYFLRDQGRVPGLSDSKYGANNLVFHNFNAVENDIYSHHQTIQSIFSDFDSKRDVILNMNDSALTEQLMAVEEHFNDPLFSLQQGEEYEDSFKLHFQSVEEALLNGQVDNDAVQDEDYLPNNTLVFEDIEDAGKAEILTGLRADIKSFQDDVAELHISLQDSRECAERQHEALKFQKGKIRQWHERFENKFGRQPSEEDKEKEASHLYLKAHEVHAELEAELEKMRVFALIATAKNTEADRLKVLKRRFARQAPAEYLPSEDSSVMSSVVHGAGGSVHHQGTLSQMQAASADLQEHSRNTYESKTASIRSDAPDGEFRVLKEELQGEVMKMSDELDMLKNFIRAADSDIDVFRGKKNRLKVDAKKWEQGYQQQHGRRPTVDERRAQAEGLYEAYATLQEALAQVLEGRERALKMVTKIQQNCDKKRRKLARVVEKEERKISHSRQERFLIPGTDLRTDAVLF